METGPGKCVECTDWSVTEVFQPLGAAPARPRAPVNEPEGPPPPVPVSPLRQRLIQALARPLDWAINP